jgi:hypothetical protein
MAASPALRAFGQVVPAVLFDEPSRVEKACTHQVQGRSRDRQTLVRKPAGGLPEDLATPTQFVDDPTLPVIGSTTGQRVQVGGT